MLESYLVLSEAPRCGTQQTCLTTLDSPLKAHILPYLQSHNMLGRQQRIRLVGSRAPRESLPLDQSTPTTKCLDDAKNLFVGYKKRKYFKFLCPFFIAWDQFRRLKIQYHIMLTEKF